MPKPFSISLSISVLPSIRRDTSFKLSSRLARVILAVWGGIVLLGLWLFVTARAQSSGQAAAPFQPCNTGPAIVARSHSSTGTLPNHVITAASDPLCTNADLTVAKTVNNAILDVGETITYTVMVTNGGPDDANGVQLTDVLPESVIFRSATPLDVCTEENNTITCDLGHLPKGDPAMVTIVVTPTQAGTITNVASVTSDASDPDPGNNTIEAIARVMGADLVVTKTVNITTPRAGDLITYTITVANKGPDDATGVQVTDTLPAGVSFGRYTGTRGTYISATGLWNVDDLVNATSATMTIAATVISCTGLTTVPNTASISAAWPNDPNPENNESRAVITPTSGVYCLYLPIIFKNYEPLVCTPYFDDFSDPNSGWKEDNDPPIQSGYSASKEYFIYRQKEGFRFEPAPVDFANQYTVEVDARWGDIGYEYGLIFGQTDATYPNYSFGVDPNGPSGPRYRVLYNISDSDWTCVTQSDDNCWADSPLIKSGLISNHLKIKCDRSTISLYVNNNPQPLWQSSNYSCRGHVGLFAQSAPWDPDAIAYFDNFQVSCFSGTDALKITEGSVPPVSTTSLDLDFRE